MCFPLLLSFLGFFEFLGSQSLYLIYILEILKNFWLWFKCHSVTIIQMFSCLIFLTSPSGAWILHILVGLYYPIDHQDFVNNFLSFFPLCTSVCMVSVAIFQVHWFFFPVFLSNVKPTRWNFQLIYFIFEFQNFYLIPFWTFHFFYRYLLIVSSLCSSFP